mgnify:FL=1
MEHHAGSGETHYTPVGFQKVLENYSGSSYINSNSKAKKWISWTKQYSSSTYENIKSVSYMLDTNIWTSKFGDNNYADYVIGGPTLEMFVASWNTKHPEEKIYCNGTRKYESSYTYSDNRYGYFVGSTSGATDYSVYIGTSDSTYVITSRNNASYFWLASPSYGLDNSGSDGAYGVMNVSYSGYIDHNGYDCSSYDTYYLTGFRPLVCLSSNVKLVSNGNGTYSLQK